MPDKPNQELPKPKPTPPARPEHDLPNNPRREPDVDRPGQELPGRGEPERPGRPTPKQ